MHLSSTGIKKAFQPNVLLLVCILMAILLLPLLPDQYKKLLYASVFTAIFFFAAFSLDNRRHLLLICAAILTILIWLEVAVHTEILKTGKYIAELVFLFSLVGGFIRQLAAKANVSASVFVDAVAGYLLLGFAYSLVVTLLINFYPGAYSNNFADFGSSKFHSLYENANYYAFMTYTTTGYGDIVPIIPIAKSLAILMSVSGQLYVATIISLIISKYISSGNKL